MSEIEIHLYGRLRKLAENAGPTDDSTIKVYLSREDIANLSNMTTSNAIRTLGSFATEEVIGIEGRKIKILNFRQLEKISDLG